MTNINKAYSVSERKTKCNNIVQYYRFYKNIFSYKYWILIETLLLMFVQFL